MQRFFVEFWIGSNQVVIPLKRQRYALPLSTVLQSLLLQSNGVVLPNVPLGS